VTNGRSRVPAFAGLGAGVSTRLLALVDHRKLRLLSVIEFGSVLEIKVSVKILVGDITSLHRSIELNEGSLEFGHTIRSLIVREYIQHISYKRK
jgi:hypothetical protein